jgi:hypothetical protein
MPATTSEIQSLDLDQLAADAARARSLFDAATVLLEGACAPSSVHTARSVLLEARALVATVAEQAEGLAARRAEAERERAACEGR